MLLALVALGALSTSARAGIVGQRVEVRGKRSVRLQIERPLGVGHSGEVFLGRDDSGATFALKIGRSERDLDKLAREFAREHASAAAVAQVDPALMKIHAVGSLKLDGRNRPALVLEAVRGVTLARRGIVNPPRAPRVALAIAERLLEVAARLEAAGYRHNDLHPENVLIEGDDPASLRLIDIGRISRTDAPTTRTRIEYGAPERRAGGGTTGVQADVYALGGVLYTLLTGHPPPKNVDAKGRQRGVSEQQIREALTGVAGLSASERQRLGGVLRTAMRTRPENRFRSFAEMRRALADVALP